MFHSCSSSGRQSIRSRGLLQEPHQLSLFCSPPGLPNSDRDTGVGQAILAEPVSKIISACKFQYFTHSSPRPFFLQTQSFNILNTRQNHIRTDGNDSGQPVYRSGDESIHLVPDLPRQHVHAPAVSRYPVYLRDDRAGIQHLRNPSEKVSGFVSISK